MLLPGSFLGVWNLISISQGHRAESISQAWLQAHGQAQIFGWIGSFILGIGFYSLTKMKTTKGFPVRAGWTAWGLWTAGVSLRWFGGVTGEAWRVLLCVSSVLQLAGFLAFYSSVRRHIPAATTHRKRQGMDAPRSWATLGFLITVVVSGCMAVYQAIYGQSPALAHWPDHSSWCLLSGAYCSHNLGVQCALDSGVSGPQATESKGAVCSVCSEHLRASSQRSPASWRWRRSCSDRFSRRHWSASRVPAQRQSPKAIERASQLSIIRAARVWLAGTLLSPRNSRRPVGLRRWNRGVSRHAITVGFIGTMVFAIGQRICRPLRNGRPLERTPHGLVALPPLSGVLSSRFLLKSLAK